jgi:hypothetical protein
MKRLTRATEDEVVLSFLRAERNSSRWSEHVATGIRDRWALLDQPNLSDDSENIARREALAYRGYGRNQFLFDGFPTNVDWSRVRLSRTEVANLLFGAGQWHDVSEGTRKVSTAAAHIASKRPIGYESVPSIISLDRSGTRFEPLIVVGRSTDGPHVLVDGYARATAYASTLSGTDIDAFAGYSADIRDWSFWQLS